jgi:hypothetical protein
MAEYNYVKRVEQIFPCGCHIDEMIDESYGITYCSKHNAAPDMYEALKVIIERLDKGLALGETLELSTARKALSKAEGR